MCNLSIVAMCHRCDTQRIGGRSKSLLNKPFKKCSSHHENTVVSFPAQYICLLHAISAAASYLYVHMQHYVMCHNWVKLNTVHELDF